MVMNELYDGVGDMGLTERILRSLLARMETCSYSTAFSGIDSPGTGFAQLRVATCAALNDYEAYHPKHIHGIVTHLELVE